MSTLLLDRAETTADVTRRRFLTAAAAAAGLLTAGCGTDQVAPARQTRTVVGARGPVEVPVAPQRVAALVGSVDVDVLALGITPVFAGSFAEVWVDLPDAVVTDAAVPPDVEVVARTRPDLLLGWEWLADEPTWSRLTALAAAVPIPEGPTWQETFLLIGDAVNRRERAEAELAAHVAVRRGRRGGRGPGLPVRAVDPVRPRPTRPPAHRRRRRRTGDDGPVVTRSVLGHTAPEEP